MTLSDRIAFQRSINPEINEVWLPADVVLETIARAESAELDRLAADAWRRHCAEQEQRRKADRRARAIIDQDSRKDRV